MEQLKKFLAGDEYYNGINLLMGLYSFIKSLHIPKFAKKEKNILKEVSSELATHEKQVNPKEKLKEHYSSCLKEAEVEPYYKDKISKYRVILNQMNHDDSCRIDKEEIKKTISALEGNGNLIVFDDNKINENIDKAHGMINAHISNLENEIASEKKLNKSSI